MAISIGGDNYCYPWSAKQGAQWGAKIRKAGAKTVLWGCSVEEEFITPEVREDLARFDLITARETFTYELLKQINPNTVLVADPAFLLEKTDSPLVPQANANLRKYDHDERDLHHYVMAVGDNLWEIVSEPVEITKIVKSEKE